MRIALAFGICVLLAGACSSFEEGKDTPASSDDAGTSADGNTAQPDAAVEEGGGGTPDGNGAPDPSLLVHWKMDDNGEQATDSVAKNHGQRFGGTWAAGKIGGAFSTLGTGYIKIAGTPKLSPLSKFTFAAWINLEAKQSEDSFIFVHGDAWSVKLNSRHPQITMGDVYFAVTKEVPAGSWHHLAVTFDEGVPAIWVDAAPTAQDNGTFPSTTRPADDLSALYIGSDGAGQTNSVGLIDDLRLYDRVLTESELEVLALQK